MLTLAAEVEHELVALGLVKEHLVSPDGGKWSIFLSRDWSSYTKVSTLYSLCVCVYTLTLSIARAALGACPWCSPWRLVPIGMYPSRTRARLDAQLCP